RDALVITERDQPQRGFCPGHVPMAIGDPGSSRDPFDLDKVGSDGHGRPEPARRTPGQGAQPSYAAARSDQIEPGVWPGEQRSRVRQVPHGRPRAGPLGLAERVMESRNLLINGGMPGYVRAGQMRPDANDLAAASGLLG